MNRCNTEAAVEVGVQQDGMSEESAQEDSGGTREQASEVRPKFGT